MKVLLLTVLLLLCSTPALTLHCFTCNDMADICETEELCEDSIKFCRIFLATNGTIIRGCAEVCDEDDGQSICCEEDFCNG